ncbi:hypothetical protein Tco_0776710 [Tanacetum coccineum]
MTISPSSFRKRYRSSYETPLPSSLALSPTLPLRKRYRGTSELIEDTEGESLESDSERDGSKDKGPDSEDKEDEEEAEPEGQPQQAVQVVDTAMDEPLGLGYRALRRHELVLGEGSVPSTFEIRQSSRSVLEQQRVEETPAPRLLTPPSLEWSFGSLPVSPSSPVVPTPVASPIDSSPVALPATVEAESFLAELGAQVELPGGLIHDHTQHLDALPPALFEGYDRDLRELYTRSRAVRDEILSHRYRFRSLKQEQERAKITFGTIWRLVLALES